MGRPYSQDLRDRILAAYDRGMKTKQIATTFNVSPAWARRVNQRRRETGETTPRRMGGAVIVKVNRQHLAALVEKRPDATLNELREELGVDCAISTISIALKKLGFTFKKRRFVRPGRIARTWSSGGRDGVNGRRRPMRAG